MTEFRATALHPRLIVDGADRAIAFYQDALGAELIERFSDPAQGGSVVHAALRVGDVTLALADENRGWGNDAPTSLGGTPVILELVVPDAYAVGVRLERAGAEVVIPIRDQFYGKREGRFRDPFGHLWIVSQLVETMTADEIQQRLRSL